MYKLDTSANICCSPVDQTNCCEPGDKSACCGTGAQDSCACTTLASVVAPLATPKNALPVVVIGAGPVGLAAAARLIERGEPFVVFEAGEAAGTSILKWGHVHVFSPWRYLIDEAARKLLEAAGWTAPDGEGYPTGREFVEHYLQPLATLPQLQPHIKTHTRVVSVARQGHDKLKNGARADMPFVVTIQTPHGEDQLLAKAIIDASGTYESPNPIGASGVPALGERALRDRIYYGIPNVLGHDRERFANRSTLVIGSGHSAFNAIMELIQLSDAEPDTRITWAVRRADVGQMFGGLADDALPARGALGERAKQAVDSGKVKFVTGFKVQRLGLHGDQIEVQTENGQVVTYDEVVAATGFRPDRQVLNELRLALDESTEAPLALAPLIDPNVHSCGSVPPHGAEELKHPEADVYIVGMKSYGRAPTFLMLTGYEQVRSVVAAIAGDWVAAREVHLALPETGVCSGGPNSPCCVSESTPQTAFVSFESLLVAPVG